MVRCWYLVKLGEEHGAVYEIMLFVFVYTCKFHSKHRVIPRERMGNPIPKTIHIPSGTHEFGLTSDQSSNSERWEKLLEEHVSQRSAVGKPETVCVLVLVNSTLNELCGRVWSCCH